MRSWIFQLRLATIGCLLLWVGIARAQVPYDQIEIDSVLSAQGIGMGAFAKPLPLPPGDWLVVGKRTETLTLGNGPTTPRIWLTLRNRHAKDDAVAAMVLSFLPDSVRINWRNAPCGEAINNALTDNFGVTPSSIQFLCGVITLSDIRKTVLSTSTTTNVWEKTNLTPLADAAGALPSKGLWINLTANKFGARAVNMVVFARQEADLGDATYASHLKGWLHEAGTALGEFLSNNASSIPALERFTPGTISEDLSGTVAQAVSPEVAARVKASAVLGKKAPGFSASTDDVKAYWVERLDAAKVLADPDAVRESAPKVIGDEPDVAKREAFYQNINKAFRSVGAYGALAKVADLYVDDGRIPLSARVVAAAKLADDWALIGDRAIAERTLSKAKDMAKRLAATDLQSAAEPVPLRLAQTEALIAVHFGDLVRGQQAYRAITDLSRQEYAKASSEPDRKKAAQNWVDSMWNASQNLVRLNRVEESMLLMDEVSLAAKNGKLGALDQISFLGSRGYALAAVGRYKEAEAALNGVVAECTKAKRPVTNNSCNVVRSLRSELRAVLGNKDGVLEDVKWIQDARAQDAIIAGNFSADSLNFAAAMASAEWERARGLASANFDRNWKRWGADHSYTKNSASQVMLAKVRDPTYKLSRAEAAEFVDLFTGTALTVGSSQRGLTFDYAAQEGLLQWIAKGNGKLGDEDATEQAFALVEYLRGASSQAALADGAAKLAATNPQLRTLIEKAQRLNDERTTKWQLASKATDSLQSAGSQKLDDSSQKKVQDEVKETQSRLAAQDAELLAVQRQIESQFPAYQELVNPRIPSVGALAKQLAPGQAYVSLFSGQNGGVVLVVKSDGSRQIAYVPEGREAVEKWVARYRRPFNASSVPERAGAWAGFDPEAAYELYRQWIKPIALALTDADTVLVAPFGALSEIPWGAVLTQSTKNFDSAKWAASQWVVVNSPGASSIMLAQYFRAAHAEKAFLAYADPLFSPQAGPAGSTTRNVRNLLVETTSVVTNAGGFDYTSVPALPDTLDEARAVAMAAGADPDQDTVTGAQATRSRVLASKLDDRRILAFATHGLRAGDLPGVSKPALAMAYEGRGLADSLLTTDDIVGLKLKADWVVLSACNTGRVEGAAGESLSGLSRAFFAAGAKALLATQWAVESSSAKQLVVDTFNAYGSANNVSRGAALAKAQRDMLSGQHGKLFQHPYFWAAYSIIGDPSR